MKIVITGGPCTGKTTTLEALRSRGHKVVEEASRKIIEEQNRKGGDLVPWKRLHDFNVAVVNMQLQLESAVQDELHFIDRGVVDNLAYCEWGKIEPPQELRQAVEQSSYHKVFLLQPLPLFENDDVRKESREDVEKLSRLLKKSYQEHGYEVIEVPPWSVEKRVEFILSRI